jgi:hypothetical protein
MQKQIKENKANHKTDEYITNKKLKINIKLDKNMNRWRAYNQKEAGSMEHKINMHLWSIKLRRSTHQWIIKLERIRKEKRSNKNE